MTMPSEQRAPARTRTPAVLFANGTIADFDDP